MKIKVGLLGLGKTGRIVAQSLFNDRKFDLVFVIKNQPSKPQDFNFIVDAKEMLPQLITTFKPDVIVDFTTPDATMENVKNIPSHIGIVIATTGFTDNQIRSLKRIKRQKILYAPNISDGINITMKACNLIHNLWKEADIEIINPHYCSFSSFSENISSKRFMTNNYFLIRHRKNYFMYSHYPTSSN